MGLQGKTAPALTDGICWMPYEGSFVQISFGIWNTAEQITTKREKMKYDQGCHAKNNFVQQEMT